tara:strand:- start:176 stop:904 length:729 start_codon:yes stop_codon:yes gene_type:complete
MTQEISDQDQKDLNEVSQAVELEQQNELVSDLGESENNINANDNSVNKEEEDSSSIESPAPLDNEARLQQLEREYESLNSQYMRIAADFDNFRKRQTRDQDDLKVQLQCNTLSEILPVVDNFERARQQLTPEGEEAQALHRSYQGLYKQLVDVLKQLGVAPMRVVGQTFDPSLHEAVLREPSDEVKEDIVIDELQRGYHLNGRVLRHALVKVSMGPGPKDDDQNNIEVDEGESTQTLDSPEN